MEEIIQNNKVSRLVLFSGGVDSTTALIWSMQMQPTEALIFKYPSIHNHQEIQSALRICKKYNIRHHLLDISSLFVGFKSALLQSDSSCIPQAYYDKENISSLLIPFRNGIFISVASGLAQSLNIPSLVIANHSGDHPLYPDCTQAFIDAMRQAVWHGSGVELLSPFCNYSKKEIVQLGMGLHIDYSQTYSCYKGTPKHCNQCPTCLESLEAFMANNLHIER